MDKNFIKLPNKKEKKNNLEDVTIIDKIKIKEKQPKPKEEDYNENYKLLRSSMRSKIRPKNKFPQEKKDMLTSVIRTTRFSNNIDQLDKLLQNSHKYMNAKKITNSKNFIDKDFPPNLESILGYIDGERIYAHKDFVWHRPKEFYTLYKKNGQKFFTKKTSENYKVFDSIDPKTMMQGRLGDCYFLAACGAIAIHPKRLERIFISGKNYNPKGLYAIAICINGIWEEILLDDYFPCSKKSRRPAYSYSNDNNLWMMLLEKAWAKIHSGYLNIACGFTGEALRDLTGAPTNSYFFDYQNFEIEDCLSEKNKKHWNLLVKGFKKKFIMCASSRNFNKGNDEIDKKLGISGNHAYSILGIYDLGEGNDPYYFLFFRTRDEIDQIKKSLGKGRMDWKMEKKSSYLESRNQKKVKS